jgi:hypothetical protein
MTSVLLIDTSFAARPIHDWLLEKDFEVWVIGNRPSDPLAMRNPERYIQENYADVAAVQAHVDRLGIKYVVPGCTDVSIETAIQLRMPVPLLDTAWSHRQLGDKAVYRALCARLNLPAPRRVELEELPMTGKLIAKPVDAFSGRGISVFNGNNRDDAVNALGLARSESRTGEALIETFADGQLYSYSAFLEGRQVVDAVVVHESGSVTPFAVDCSYVCHDFSPECQDELKRAVETVAAELKLVDGLIHTQFIWDGASLFIVEMSRRCPGDLYPTLVELSTGRRHAARYASYFVEQPTSEDGPALGRHILRHTVTAEHRSYEGFWLRRPTPVVEFHPLSPVGRTPPSLDRIDRVALLFAEYSSTDTLEKEISLFLEQSSYITSVAISK